MKERTPGSILISIETNGLELTKVMAVLGYAMKLPWITIDQLEAVKSVHAKFLSEWKAAESIRSAIAEESTKGDPQ